MGVSHQSVWRVLRHNLLYPYMQWVQTLSAADYSPRVMFCEWYLQRCIEPIFQQRVFFTNKAIFTRNVIVNFHNNHQWADVNPHAIIQSRQQQFLWNVWASIIGDYLIGPIFLPSRLNAPNYRNFLENELFHCWRTFHWVRGSSCGSCMTVPQPTLASLLGNFLINTTLAVGLIGGPTAWLPCSLDLNSLNFFVWRYQESCLYYISSWLTGSYCWWV